MTITLVLTQTRYNESKANRDLYLADYAKLYLDVMRPAIAAADPDARPFVDSSPSNGLVSTLPYVKRWDGAGKGGADSAQAASWGDVHYYDYEADCEVHSEYSHSKYSHSKYSMHYYDHEADCEVRPR